MRQIIPKNPVTVESNWQKELASGFSDPLALLEYLQLDVGKYADHGAARKLFAMRVPRPFAARMKKGDWQDPLLRQVMPLDLEFADVPGFSVDPLLEQDNTTPGILHKYLNRALLIVRGGCAVNCRYCFRRHFPYADNNMNKRQWQQSLAYIRQDSNIDEVILSGGDPLMAKDDFLTWLIDELATIPQLKRLRIHTRLPVVIPQRITPELTSLLTRPRFQTIVVLHINHANELDSSLGDHCRDLRNQGVTLLNQSVLLQGVNDDPMQLMALHERLFEYGILPYYLHLLDKVAGAAHFDVSEGKARRIMAEVIKRQPGYLVPKLVREIGGQPGKTPIDLHLHP